MRRPTPLSAPHGCLVLAALVAGCAHQNFIQTTTLSLQTTVQLTDVVRTQANAVADQQQKQAVADLEAAVAKIPADAPDRAARVEACKATTAAKLTEIQTRRDRVLAATGEVQRVLGMAALLLPLVEDQPEKKADVVRLIAEAYAALEKAK